MARMKIGCRCPDTSDKGTEPLYNVKYQCNIAARCLDESILCIYIENSQFLVLTQCYQHSKSDECQHSKYSQLCRDDSGH